MYETSKPPNRQTAKPLIGIDCRFATLHAGLGTYSQSIVRAMLARRDPWSYALFVRSRHEEWLTDIKHEGTAIIEAPIPHYSVAEQWRLPHLIRRSGCDLFFAPHFNVPLRCPVPFITTIHDLILHRYSGESSWMKSIAYRFTVASALRRAKKIITVSNFTADELQKIYGSPIMTKTQIIYPGVSPSFSMRSQAEQHSVKQKYRLTKPFLLYVGGNKPHKNVPMLLRAFRLAAIDDVDLVLVSDNCGKISMQDHVHVFGNVSEFDLSCLYSAALGSVTATLAEGFYLPAIEAMACGCPVLATNVGAIPEITGGHAILAKPTEQSLVAGLRMIATENILRQDDKRSARIGYARGFSWDRTAEETAKVFRREAGV